MKLLPYILFEKHINILALCFIVDKMEMASRRNQHCANCIGTLSFPICLLRLRHKRQRRTGVECDVDDCIVWQTVLGTDAVMNQRNVVQVETLNFSSERVHLPILSLTLGRNDMVRLHFTPSISIIYDSQRNLNVVYLVAVELFFYRVAKTFTPSVVDRLFYVKVKVIFKNACSVTFSISCCSVFQI